MSDIRENQEREELHKAIWNIANNLRGSVDGWDFKQYVLGFMFYRYISENLTNFINKGERDAGNPSFDYSNISDEDAAPIRNEHSQKHRISGYGKQTIRFEFRSCRMINSHTP